MSDSEYVPPHFVSLSHFYKASHSVEWTRLKQNMKGVLFHDNEAQSRFADPSEQSV